MIFAIPAAPAAIPPNPNKAAIKATTKKITIHLIMILSVLVETLFTSGEVQGFGQTGIH